LPSGRWWKKDSSQQVWPAPELYLTPICREKLEKVHPELWGSQSSSWTERVEAPGRSKGSQAVGVGPSEERGVVEARVRGQSWERSSGLSTGRACATLLGLGPVMSYSSHLFPHSCVSLCTPSFLPLLAQESSPLCTIQWQILLSSPSIHPSIQHLSIRSSIHPSLHPSQVRSQ
jgi:hypothetical protein